MPTYKLTYFDIRGRAECLRMLMHLSDIPFEDVRVSFEQWSTLKPTTQWGQLPILEVDGQQMTQTFAIARYLARKTGYAGKTDWELYEIDQIAGMLEDIYAMLRPWIQEKDPERKKQIREPIDAKIKTFLAAMEQRINNSKSGYFVGDGLTWIDLEMSERVLFYKTEKPEMIQGHDGLLKFMEKVHNHQKLKQYIQNRKS